MNQDPEVRQEARGVLERLFSGIGQRASGQQAPADDPFEGMLGQLEELVSMPADLARIFLTMAVELTDATLTALEESGFVLVKALTPL